MYIEDYDQESMNCPAKVYSDRGCTMEIGDNDDVGFMMWGRRVAVVRKLGTLWVPFNMVHQIISTYPPALRSAA
jgi:hypothetical protein